jgi:lipid-binding SYLF domain-containing protein
MKLVAILTIVCLAGLSVPADADWTAEAGDRVQAKAGKAVQAFRERVPRTEAYFKDAYGYAIYPSITRIGFGFGGAYGKGLVVAGDNLTGRSKYWQFTSGIQAGAKNFSMIIFFRDKEALEYFQLGKTQFMGQSGIAVGTMGAAGTPGYSDGVAVVTMTRLGLMGEFTVSGAKFSYEPLEVSD